MDKNSKEYESLQAKLKKLLALAEQGVGGEAVNARRLLEKLCEQYGIDIEELLDRETKHSYTFEIGRAKEMQVSATFSVRIPTKCKRLLFR